MNAYRLFVIKIILQKKKVILFYNKVSFLLKEKLF